MRQPLAASQRTSHTPHAVLFSACSSARPRWVLGRSTPQPQGRPTWNVDLRSVVGSPDTIRPRTAATSRASATSRSCARQGRGLGRGGGRERLWWGVAAS